MFQFLEYKKIKIHWFFLPNKNRHSKLLPIQGYRNVLNNDLLKIILSGLGKLENLKKLYVDNCDLT